MNVTALVSAAGSVVERYLYSPYGQPTVLNPDWSADEDGASDYDNEILYCGYRHRHGNSRMVTVLGSLER